jgi:hypothetical protein
MAASPNHPRTLRGTERIAYLSAITGGIPQDIIQAGITIWNLFDISKGNDVL